MLHPHLTYTQIVQQGVLPLYFHPDMEVSLDVLRALYRAGIRAVEYTNRGEAASRNFKALIAERDTSLPGMYIGVGTIKNEDQAALFQELGADFMVSPGWVPALAHYANTHDFFYAPGCMTPGEIIAAEQVGMRFIKLFPGDLLGPSFVAGIRDIFPHLSFMPTGGVDTSESNLQAWFRSGVVAVGMGSKLVSKALMEKRDYAAIESETKKVLALIHTLRVSA